MQIFAVSTTQSVLHIVKEAFSIFVLEELNLAVFQMAPKCDTITIMENEPTTICCVFLSSQEDAFTFANQVGYPCLLRPSYVLR